eukprot:3557906-Prymnesium_polylepis.1
MRSPQTGCPLPPSREECMGLAPGLLSTYLGANHPHLVVSSVSAGASTALPGLRVGSWLLGAFGPFGGCGFFEG